MASLLTGAIIAGGWAPHSGTVYCKLSTVHALLSNSSNYSGKLEISVPSAATDPFSGQQVSTAERT